MTRIPKGNERSICGEVRESLEIPDQDNGANARSQVLALNPLTEIVGTVRGIGEMYVVIECVQRFKIPRETFSPDQIERLSEGAEVGVLFMDNGTARIREGNPAHRVDATVVRVLASCHAEP